MLHFPMIRHAAAAGVLLAALCSVGCREPGGVEGVPTDVPASSASGKQGNESPEDASSSSAPLTRTPFQFMLMPSAGGIDFAYRNGEEAGKYSILESLGGGVAMLDFDRDGVLDLFFPGGGRFGPQQSINGCSPVLFRHRGAWEFADVTEASRVNIPGFYSHGAAAADVDNDGFQDVLITGYGGLLLFHNEGDGTFTERADDVGLVDPLWSSSAAWGDVNSDGCLDLYVVHYVNWSFENDPQCIADDPPGAHEICPPLEFEPLADRLFLADGEGHYLDASQDARLRADGKGLGIVMVDMNRDGHLDVYVANDTEQNFLYENDGHGRLIESGLTSGTGLSDRGTPDGSMGVDVGDYDLDGRPDIWVANYERESFALYRNEGDGFYRHVSRSAGVTAVGGLFVGWGTAFFDGDRDGDEDVVTSNGHVIRHPEAAQVRQTPLLFENRIGEAAGFVNVAPLAGAYFNQPHMGRGLAVGDLDNDGDLDLAVSHTNEPVALLSNEATDGNNWLSLQLVGVRGPRDAIGARVTLTLNDGRQQTRQVKGGGSYASTSDRRVSFGTGEHETVAELTIHWPGGRTERLKSVPGNQHLIVVEGGRALPAE